MKLTLINQFFPPAQAPTGILLYDLAVMLAQRGHAVTVLASAAGYGAGANGAAADPEGVRVVRLGSRGHHGNRFAGKLAEYMRFYYAARRHLFRQLAADAVVCLTTPPFIGSPGAQAWAELGMPYVLWCMDLYPEALLAHGWLHPWNPLLSLLKRLAQKERRRAASVIALGPDMAEHLRNRGAVNVEMIPVWSNLRPDDSLDIAARQCRRERGWADGDTILLYSGNMGRAHSAEEFAVLARHMQAILPRCRFVFAGDGSARKEWERRWGDLFEFMPPVSAEQAAAHLRAADVHLVSQRPEWTGVVVPSKFQAACALGRPVAFAGSPHSAVGRWLAAADAGWLLPSATNEYQSIALELMDARLRDVKGARALRLHRDDFSAEDNCARLADIVEKAGQGWP